MAARTALTRGQKALVAVVVVIAGIGFTGSYIGVRRLGERNGFGWYSYLLPVGIDAGIAVFLGLDLLLTWLKMPLGMLRPLAWLLTGATIAFNAASAWPNALAMAIRAVIPLLFVAAAEAGRHAVARMAEVTEGRLMERIRFGRWLVAPVSTFRLWRRRLLWEVRSYEEALELERRRLMYRAHLESEYGPRWKKDAPVRARMPLRMAKYGEPLPRVELAGPAAAPQPVQLSAPSWQALGTEAGDDQLRIDLPAQGRSRIAPASETVRASSTVPEDVTANTGRHTETPAAPAAQPQIPAAAEQVPAVVVPEHYLDAFVKYVDQNGTRPDAARLAAQLFSMGVTGRAGKPLSANSVRRYLPHLSAQYDQRASGVDLVTTS
ncbi:uncharacterized protein DUF2637 [Streptomyces sp. 846.5]|nr:DUF2637 domain-containing protein [Streptomyces sp. 846.5]TDT94175.1 uncharacterized protein DUF2637 [Streptomyces sp. 846.5]